LTVGKVTDTIKAKLIVTLRYGFRSWPNGPATWILGAVMVTTASGTGRDAWRGSEPAEELDAVTVRANRERLGLAPAALTENAVRHTGCDGDIQFPVIRNYPGMPVRIVVADAGAGIPADQLPFIFDRFRTSDGEQSRGTGLGLPLVRAVALAHGGDVTVRSKHG
jgi:two-component system, OmpR family, sensor histidine kinase BaeS